MSDEVVHSDTLPVAPELIAHTETLHTALKARQEARLDTPRHRRMQKLEAQKEQIDAVALGTVAGNVQPQPAAEGPELPGHGDPAPEHGDPAPEEADIGPEAPAAAPLAPVEADPATLPPHNIIAVDDPASWDEHWRRQDELAGIVEPLNESEFGERFNVIFQDDPKLALDMFAARMFARLEAQQRIGLQAFGNMQYGAQVSQAVYKACDEWCNELFDRHPDLKPLQGDVLAYIGEHGGGQGGVVRAVISGVESGRSHQDKSAKGFRAWRQRLAPPAEVETRYVPIEPASATQEKVPETLAEKLKARRQARRGQK